MNIFCQRTSNINKDRKISKYLLWYDKGARWCFFKKTFFDGSGSIDKIGRAARLPREGSSSLFSLSTLQLNNTCTQSPKHVNEDLNCSPITDLHMDSIISKNRSWRIELCADVCDDVQSDCGEHLLIPLELMYAKLQRTISFAIDFWFDSFLQRWKALVKLHNLAYFNIYHMLRCCKVVTAVSFDVHFYVSSLGREK